MSACRTPYRTGSGAWSSDRGHCTRPGSRWTTPALPRTLPASVRPPTTDAPHDDANPLAAGPAGAVVSRRDRGALAGAGGGVGGLGVRRLRGAGLRLVHERGPS